MFRARSVLIVISLLLCGTLPSAQLQTTVKIAVALVDGDLNVKPVPRHALIVKSLKTSAATKVVTGFDGRTTIQLSPGDYTIESEQPIEFQGKSYRWSKALVVDGADAVSVELSVDNAIVESLEADGRPVAPKSNDATNTIAAGSTSGTASVIVYRLKRC